MIRPELLDNASEADKRANLADLVRVGRLLGGHRILRGLIRRVTSPHESFSVLDVGSANGDSAAVIRGVRPHASVTCLDYHLDHLACAPHPKVVGDAFRLPFAERSFDFVFSSLFLHHFENTAVIELLRGFQIVARRAILAIDLERGPLAYHFLPRSRWLFRWHWMTVHDGQRSVEAAFKKRELDGLARSAGLSKVEVRQHRPWARLSLLAR